MSASVAALEGLTPSWVVAQAITARGLRRMRRVPSIFLPTIIMPMFFLIAFTGSFDSLSQVPGYGTDNTVNWMIPWALLQGSAFGGMGAGGAIATDLESGFFDRLLAAPIRLGAVVAGVIGYVMVRTSVPIVMVTALGFLLGADLPGGVLGLVMLVVGALGTAFVMSLLVLSIVLKFRSLRALGLAQIVMFTLMFLSIGQVPLEFMTGWLQDVARINPMTQIIQLARQGLIGSVTWADTWPGLVAMCGLGAFFWLGVRTQLRRLVP